MESEGRLLAVAAALEMLGLDDSRNRLSTTDFRCSVRRDELLDARQSYRTLGAVLAGIGLLAILVSSPVVVNTMLMATLERTKEIGVMRAIGAGGTPSGCSRSRPACSALSAARRASSSLRPAS